MIERVWGIVYRAVHHASGRFYIGQTYSLKKKAPAVLLLNRRTRHLRSALNCARASSHFHAAIRKYGPEAFTWEVVAEAYTIGDLNRLESEAIRRFNSSSDLEGFNSRLEGDNRIYTSSAKRNMAASAKMRWVQMDSEEKRALTTKQVSGRAKVPGLRVRYAENMRLLRQDALLNERRIANLRAALQSNAFRSKRAEISKAYWSDAAPSQRESAREALAQSLPIRTMRLQEVRATPEYKSNLTNANRKRRERPFSVYRYSDGTHVAAFKNVIDAARRFDAHAQNISLVLHGRNKSFTGKSAAAKSLGRLVARWNDTEVKSEPLRYARAMRSVSIRIAATGKEVERFEGLRLAERALGARIGSVLRGVTKTFRARAERYASLGLLTAHYVNVL